MRRVPTLLTQLLALTTVLPAQSPPSAAPMTQSNVQVLGDFPIVEYRRYRIKVGEREHFAQYFESFFPEAFEQLGAIAAGSFFVRGDPTRFTWIRGYHTIEARAVINAAFYYGPLWWEHRTTLNHLIDDSDDVLLLRALSPERAVRILPAVDPVTESGGARGVIVSLVCRLKPGTTDAFATLAQPVFEKYRAAGARETALLVTLDVPNNFPQLPVRTDGPYLVWLGLLPDNTVLDRFKRAAEGAMAELVASGMTRDRPEIVVLDPTPRSRMRWLGEP